MKERLITTPADLVKVSADLAGYAQYLPFVVTITQGKKIRTDSQNSRYWAMLNENLNMVNEAINTVEENGYTNLEARKVIANEIPAEHAAILFVRKAEAAHEILKIVCGIPTSTKLGTKEFIRFEEQMEQTLYEIVGSIRSVARRAAG